MPHALRHHREIIDYLGRQHAMPGLFMESGDPTLLRPGDEPEGAVRTSWERFFAALESRGLILIVSDPFAHTEPDAPLDASWSTPRRLKSALGKDYRSFWRRLADFARALPRVAVG